MAKPSVSMPDQFYDDFKEAVFRAKGKGEMPRDANKSEAIRHAMRNVIEEHYPEAESLSEGNRTRATA